MIFESKEKNMKKILKNGKTLLLAFDHAVEHGPHKYEGIDLSPKRIGELAFKGKVDGVIVHIGAAKIIKRLFPSLNIIVKLTGRDDLVKDEIQIQEVVTSVKEAKKIGAAAIAVTIYFGSDFESQMLSNFVKIKEEAEKYKLPIVGFAYPRSPKFKSKYDPIAVRYASRIGAEIGFDIVKTYYTGDKESFSKVVKDCFVPVVVAGGPKIENKEEFLRMVDDVLEVGASGIAVGRNVWERNDNEALLLLEELRRRIHK